MCSTHLSHVFDKDFKLAIFFINQFALGFISLLLFANFVDSTHYVQTTKFTDVASTDFSSKALNLYFLISSIKFGNLKTYSSSFFFLIFYLHISMPSLLHSKYICINHDLLACLTIWQWSDEIFSNFLSRDNFFLPTHFDFCFLSSQIFSFLVSSTYFLQYF